MLQYKAQLIRMDSNIEELGVFLINNIELICFISYSEFPLELGKEYFIELNYQIFNEYKINIASDKDKTGFINIDNGFSYLLTGVFKGIILNINGIEFIDEYLLTDFFYFENKKITLLVDRLDIAICGECNIASVG